MLKIFIFLKQNVVFDLTSTSSSSIGQCLYIQTNARFWTNDGNDENAGKYLKLMLNKPFFEYFLVVETRGPPRRHKKNKVILKNDYNLHLLPFSTLGSFQFNVCSFL